MIISTFNIQNDISKYSKEKEKLIINYLKKNKIDILNLQELYKPLYKELKKDLKKINYNISNRFRYRIPLLFNRINESTPIITNKNVLYTKTYWLPHFPSLLNRIITKTVIEYNNELISIYNTHLDYKYDEVKQKQINKVLDIIRKDKNKIILTGDFNLKNNKEIFNNFVKKLEKLNIYRVELNDKTLKISKYHRAIDHIFLSKDFKVIKKEIVKDLGTSDHYPLLIEIK